MAKTGLFGARSPGPMRPVPRPDGLGMAAPAPQGRGGFPAIFSRGPGGILPERGSQTQYDLVTSLVQSAMQAAPTSGSPLLAALAPMLGGAALSRVEGMRDIGRQREQDGVAASLFGRPMTESERQLMEVMGNEDLPGFYRTEAERRLRAAMTGQPATGGGGSRGGGSSPNPAAPGAVPVDEMTLLLEATNGSTLLTEPQRRVMFDMLRDPNATSQERQMAQTLLDRHDRAIREGTANPAGLPAAPNVPTEAPQMPVTPMAAPEAPASPGFWPFGGNAAADVPPPPPGTVPF